MAERRESLTKMTMMPIDNKGDDLILLQPFTPGSVTKPYSDWIDQHVYQ